MKRTTTNPPSTPTSSTATRETGTMDGWPTPAKTDAVSPDLSIVSPGGDLSAPPGGLDLDVIEARAAAATPGPWEANAEQYHSEFGTIIGGEVKPIAQAWLSGEDGWVYPLTPADAVFIAAARSDVPALAAEVRRLRVELAEARDEATKCGENYRRTAIECAHRGDKIDQLQRELVAAQADQRRLKDELRLARDRAAAFESDSDELEAELAGLRAQQDDSGETEVQFGFYDGEGGIVGGYDTFEDARSDSAHYVGSYEVSREIHPGPWRLVSADPNKEGQ